MVCSGERVSGPRHAAARAGAFDLRRDRVPAVAERAGQGGAFGERGVVGMEVAHGQAIDHVLVEVAQVDGDGAARLHVERREQAFLEDPHGVTDRTSLLGTSRRCNAPRAAAISPLTAWYSMATSLCGLAPSTPVVALTLRYRPSTVGRFPG